MDAPACRFFMQGNCRYADECRFKHATDADPGDAPSTTRARSSAPCRYFAKGNCTYGEDCWFSHDSATTADQSRSQAPSAGGSQMSSRGRGGRGRGRGRSYPPPAAEVPVPPVQNDAASEEELADQRTENGGFTNDDVDELAIQGLKPYEDDAADALAALSVED